MTIIQNNKIVIELITPTPAVELKTIQHTLIYLIKNFFKEEDIKLENGTVLDFYPLMNLIGSLQNAVHKQ